MLKKIVLYVPCTGALNDFDLREFYGLSFFQLITINMWVWEQAEGRGQARDQQQERVAN
jgi:hypothetical protein